MNTPFGKDFLELFIEAARRFNLKVGFYYSWMEFLHKPNKEYLTTIVIPQMNELMRYNVDRYFFDGDWEFNTKVADKTFSDIVNKIRDMNPNVEINDRISGCKQTRDLYDDINYLGLSTYRTYADREIPERPNVPWEHINTIGLSWGANIEQKDFKSGEELYLLYNNVKNKGGNFLLNMGPLSDGTLDPLEIKSINELSKYI